MFSTLIADDSSLFRHTLRNILSRHFPCMLLLEAASGKTAVALAMEHRPQLVFIDIKLPDGSGLDLARQFKSLNPAAAVYVVTHYDLQEYRQAAVQCGADHFIVKDDSSEEAIVAMVEWMISSRFRVLLANRGQELRDQVDNLLTRHWPGMLLIGVPAGPFADTETAWLRPDALIFSSTKRPLSRDETLDALRSRHPEADLVIITESVHSASSFPPLPFHRGSAFWVPRSDGFGEKLVAVFDAIVTARRQQTTQRTT